MFVNQPFTYLTCTYLKSKGRSNVKSSTYYFHMKTKIFADFQICISVPLSNLFYDFWEDCFCKLKLLLAANRLIYLNISMSIQKTHGPQTPQAP